MVELVVLGAAAGAYGVWRYRREERYSRKAQSVMPDSKKLQLAFSGGRNVNKAHEPRFMSGWKEAAGIGAAGAVPSMYYLSEIDPTVMDTLDFAFAQDLSNFNTMTDYISDKYFDVLGTPSAEGWMTRFEGYVMEMHSVDVLENLGYEVELPDTANQEGWDVLLDGEPWQVKGGQSPQVISEHFDKYPDIPVITNAGLGAHFEGYDNVMVLDDVSAEAISEMAHGGLETPLNLDSSIGAGIPVVSVIMSSYREVKLHRDNKTDFGSSVKNVSLDAAGVGGGGYAGAQAGAAIGAFGGPAGAVVGGLIGGIAGAVGGKLGTNAVKEMAMKEAFRNYETTAAEVEYVLDEEQEKERTVMWNMVSSVNSDLNNAKKMLEDSYKQQFYKQKRNVADSERHFLKAVPDIIRSVKKELRSVERKLDESYEQPSLLKKYLYPGYEDIAHKQMKKWFKERYAILERASSRFSQASDVYRLSDRDIQKLYAEAIQFFQYYEVKSDSLEKMLAAIIHKADQADAQRDSMKKDFYLHVLQAEEAVRNRAKQSFTRLAEKAVIEKERVKAAYDAYMYERGKLGR